MIIEICTNSEWIYNSLLDPDSIDHAWQDEAASEWVGQVVIGLGDLGHETELARGQRGMYHGWNGANTFKRKYCGLGTFDECTNEEWDEACAVACGATNEVNDTAAWAPVQEPTP